MTVATHTPGPWTVKEYGGGDAPALVIHKGGESRICFMATPGFGFHGDPAKIEANARLITAAPDLLEAAQLLEAAECCEQCFPLLGEARVKRRLAIAKATGDA